MIRDIRLFGDPVLREKAAPVEEIDDEIRQLIDDLIETMYDADGIGLAAPQVGVPLRIFVYDIRDPEREAGVLVNPEIVESSGSEKDEEGCLSLPGSPSWWSGRSRSSCAVWTRAVRPWSSPPMGCSAGASSTRRTTSTACSSSTVSAR